MFEKIKEIVAPTREVGYRTASGESIKCRPNNLDKKNWVSGFCESDRELIRMRDIRDINEVSISFREPIIERHLSRDYSRVETGVRIVKIGMKVGMAALAVYNPAILPKVKSFTDFL